MKTTWNKTPAWIRAILLNLLFLFPASIGVQLIIQYSLESGASWGWSLIPTVAILEGYWFLTKKVNPYKGEGYIKHSFKVDFSDRNVWLKLTGIMLFTAFMIQFFVLVMPSENNVQLAMFRAFRGLPLAIVLPTLLAYALMAGIVEEVTYRGFMQNTMSKYPKWLNFLLVGVFFSSVHQLPLQLFIPYVFVSMGFSIVAYQQRSLGLVIFGHILVDFLIFVGIVKDVFNTTDPSPQALTWAALGAILGGYLLVRDLKWSELGITSAKEQLATSD